MEALNLRAAHHHVYGELRSGITEGEFVSGERLDERALSVALGVSRTPVREAITRLVSDGLVEHRRYEGNFVRQFRAAQVAGMFDVRCALEELAVRQAIQRLTPATLAGIREALDDACAALEQGEMEAFAAADRRFHRIVSDGSENETLTEMLENLDAQIHLVRVIANRDPELVKRTILERDRILQAFEARDSDRAAELMRTHIEGVKATVLRQLTLEQPTSASE